MIVIRKENYIKGNIISIIGSSKESFNNYKNILLRLSHLYNATANFYYYSYQFVSLMYVIGLHIIKL